MNTLSEVKAGYEPLGVFPGDRLLCDIICVQNVQLGATDDLGVQIRFESKANKGPRDLRSRVVSVVLVPEYSSRLTVTYRETWSDGSVTYLLSKICNYADIDADAERRANLEK